MNTEKIKEYEEKLSIVKDKQVVIPKTLNKKLREALEEYNSKYFNEQIYFEEELKKWQSQ